MKKLITLLFLVLSGISYSQTMSDIVPKNIDINYINSLVLQICNERTKDSSVFKIPNSFTFECAEYQSSYMAKYSVCTHKDLNIHKGVILTSISDRKNYFDKNGELTSIAEVCTFATIDEITYEELANKIIDNFFSSTPHRKTIFNNYPYGSFSCSYGTYDGQSGVYVTGFFSR